VQHDRGTVDGRVLSRGWPVLAGSSSSINGHFSAVLLRGLNIWPAADTLLNVGDDSDEMVWRLVLSGDSRRYGTIWDRHRDRIFRHLIASGNTPTSAEDLTAATFLELWHRRRAVRFVDGSLLPWLIVTARNVSRNDARGTRGYERFLAAIMADLVTWRQLWLPTPPVVPDPAEPPVVPDPADRIADRDDDHLIALRAAIAAARPADATLLAMTALEGFTIREAATALGLSESAAKMRLSRLRARLGTAVMALPPPEGGS